MESEWVGVGGGSGWGQGLGSSEHTICRSPIKGILLLIIHIDHERNITIDIICCFNASSLLAHAFDNRFDGLCVVSNVFEL